MIIGVNLLSIFPGVSGGGQTYVENLLKSLSRIDSKNTYYLFVNEINKDLFPQHERFIRIICPVSKKNLCYRIIWEQFILPAHIRKHKIDLLFSPTNFSPIFWLPSKSVLNICDVYWAHFKQYFSKIEYLFLKYLIIFSARKANRIITISKYTKTEVIKYARMDEAKIIPIHLGRGNSLSPADGGYKPEADIFKQTGDRYLLAVGRTHEHKNYMNLIEAFKLLKKNRPDAARKMIIAGIPGRQHKKLQEKIEFESLSDEVLLLGRVDDNKLLWLYRHAHLFIFPSIYEGFGLPLLEAMAFGIPIACSNITALPEIGGEAVLCFDPFDIHDIAKKIDMLLSSENLRNELVKKGLERVKRFSWENTARKTLAVFEDVYNNA